MLVAGWCGARQAPSACFWAIERRDKRGCRPLTSPPARGNRHHAGARHLDQAERRIRSTNWSILSLRAGDLEDEALDRGVDHARAEGVGEAQRLDPVVALAAHLDHRELALDRRAGLGQVDHALHRHQPLELMADLLDHHRRAGGDDGDAREVLLVLGLRDREAVDIVAARGEQPDDAREHARLVVDQHRERVALDALLHGRGRIVARACGTVAHHTSTLPRSSIAFGDVAGHVAEQHLVMRLARRDHREAVLQPDRPRSRRSPACRRRSSP